MTTPQPPIASNLRASLAPATIARPTEVHAGGVYQVVQAMAAAIVALPGCDVDWLPLAEELPELGRC